MMTEQIVIKLNKKKFEPILNKINSFGKCTSKSNSECVAKSLFFVYLYSSEKLEKLENKTRAEFVMQKVGDDYNKNLIDFISKYQKFLSE